MQDSSFPLFRFLTALSMIKNNCSLLEHNTFGINVKTSKFIEYNSVKELQEMILQGLITDPWLHIGRGSNILFTKDFDGMIVHSKITDIETVIEKDDYVDVKVGGGVVWDDFVKITVEKGWYGAENLSLIPGEVGASAVQNIGAYGVEVKDLITEVEGVDMKSGEIRLFSNVDCDYAYRHSIFKTDLKGRYAITHVTYRLCKEFVPHLDYGNIRAALPADNTNLTAVDVRKAIINIRNSKLPDPKITGNAGSFFMNPIVSIKKFEELLKLYPTMPHYDAKGGVKVPAGWLIEQCGLKGMIQGHVGVHKDQALVLVNYGGAMPEEIVALSDFIREKVKNKFGIDIKPEVIFV